MDIVRKRFLVTGRVQGVGYRWFTRKCAERLGLAGFVRNLPDGSVLCEAEGSSSAIASFTAEIEIGPPHCSVARLLATELAVEGGLRDFAVLP